ncbi:hypothetical protein VPNG_08440 [Cytospora leucostoma]|uniref:Inositol polyphosphate-related phosphatase domain-containing protein n=1 Tax=Cytospora leucostoma TaxID=1230097 RepID=A0A423WR95_9PEZI|nr:hypothetical protein VPNG_08440 [Cytospora leucostoma]
MAASPPERSASVASDPADLSLPSPQSLGRAVYARRTEYTRTRRIKVKVGTWNVAACPGTDKDLASWFIDGEGIDTKLAGPDLSDNPAVETRDLGDGASPDSGSARLSGRDQIGLYVLGLQEVVNLNPVTQYVYSEPNPTDKWRLALEAALPAGYEFVGSEQMSGLLLLMYASPDVAPCISNFSTRSIGTGVGGWLGNKGATVARVVLGETTKLVFVNSHLSSGNDSATVERRCWDTRAILDRARFNPIVIAGDVQEENQDRIDDADFAFWFGDLNFRLDGIPGDDIRRLLLLHTRGDYDLNKPKETLKGEEGIIVARTTDSSNDQADDVSTDTRPTAQSSDDDSLSLPDPDDFEPDPHEDPVSLQAILDSLLPHDQLLRVRKERRVFHDGWREGPITFLPSYKYDVGTVGLFDSSEKKRAPSWCDRIMYRTRRDKEQYTRQIREDEEARKRDEEMRARGIDHAGDDDEVLFDYDPDNDGDTTPSGEPGLDYDEYDEGGDDAAAADATDVDAVDRIDLQLYTSHQRIASSDHKPIVAIFTLDFDAVVPELKAEIYAQVARELDRAENEGRPTITVAMEGKESGNASVDFGELTFLKKKYTSFTLANTGGVPASVTFVEKPAPEDADNSELPQWLTASFYRAQAGEARDEILGLGKEVILEPGETVNAALEIIVDKVSQATMLNDGRGKLEEVLVLRVVDGRDHFIPVRANWAPSCIGRSVDELIRVPDGGIRALVASLSDKGGKHTGKIPHEVDVHRSAPKELFRLVEAVEVLTDRTLAEEEMLGSYTVPRGNPGWPFEDFVAGSHADLLPRVIDVLDTDRPIADAFPPEANPCQRLETVAEVLVYFLQGLTDGVISLPIWTRIEHAPIRCLGQGRPLSSPTADASEDDKSEILDILMTAPNHQICFVFLTTTLAKVIGELAPLRKSEIEALKTATFQQAGGGMAAIGALGRRSLSFRRSLTGTAPGSGTSTFEAIAALEKRKSRERRVAQIFGEVVCRVPVPAKEKERRTLEDKEKMLVELFLRRGEVFERV